MATISERLRERLAASAKNYDALNTGAERCQAAALGLTDADLVSIRDTIDALVAALERVMKWAGPIAGDNQDPAAAAEEEASKEQADAALALARGEK